MRLILDTNLLFKGGHYLQRGQWPVLVSAARMGLVRLYVPEVVVREQVAHYRRDVERAVRDEQAADRTLGRLQPPDLRGISTHSYPAPSRWDRIEVGRWVESYEWWLRRFIAEHGQVLPLPTRTHDDLLDALFHARKPFSAGEKGYKDALIWWTLVEALDGDSWVFGTDNSKDFLSHDLATLAADLVEDVRSLSLDPSQIGVRTSLDEIVAELVPSDVAVEDQFLAIARSSEGSEHIASLIQEQRFPLDDPSGLMPRWPKWIETTGEMDDPEFGQAEARPVEGGFLVRALVTATSHVAGGLEEDLSPDPGPDWGTWDDWGVGVTYAYERPQRVTYEMTFKFTPPAEVSEVQVESVVLNAPWLAAGHPRPRP